MLNNGAASQSDAYAGLGYGQQYAQNMTSTLNGQQPAYGATGIHPKRQAGLHQQAQMQQNLPARRATQRAGMSANFPYNQYPPGRGQGMPASNAPMMRPTQGAVPAHAPQYPAMTGATRTNMTSTASSTANLRVINPQAGHAGLSQVHGDTAFASQGHHIRYGMQQPPAHLQQDHVQRTNPTALPAANRADLGPGQHGVTNPSASGIFVPSHSQHSQVSEASFRARPAAAAPSNNPQRRVLPARIEATAVEKEGLLDSRDFPALGGLHGRGPGHAEATTNGLATLSLRGNVALGKAGGPLDSSDFPALNNPAGRMHANFNAMAGGGRILHNDAGHDSFAEAPTARQAPANVRDDSDSMGLKGLLPQIRNDNPSETYISLGVDLNALGLDLSGQEPLYPNLSSPWSAGGRMGEVDMMLPHWFLFKPPELQPRAMERFSTAGVMAIFYIFAGTFLKRMHEMRGVTCFQKS